MNKSMTVILLPITLLSFFYSTQAFSEGSYELSCRMKAKEIAAETYKGCVTENRQAQLEQIRKEYKEKLSELKSHYDKELKKMAGGTKALSSDEAASNQETAAPQKKISKKTEAKTRPSGARSLPPKKAVRTQVIDLSTPAETPDTTEVDSIQSQNRLKSDVDEANNVEVVELPTQE